MKKFRLLLLDANIVIQLHEIGLWAAVVEKCEVLLSRVVAEQESKFHEAGEGAQAKIDLSQDIAQKRILVVDVLPSQLKAFLAKFDKAFLDRLDPGEAESLAYLDQSKETCLISSADAIVFRVLAVLDRSEQGVSLEEILQKIGFGRTLSWQFSKKFREHWTAVGFDERMRDNGLKK